MGGTHPIAVNVRLIAATNRDLRTLVRAGQFREDLFYRLEGIPITLPPLRARPGDIRLLVAHFLAQVNRTSPRQIRGVRARALERLGRYAWPGNVRELENAIARAAVLAIGTSSTSPTFPRSVRRPGPAPPPRHGSGARRPQARGDAADRRAADPTRTPIDGGAIHGDPAGAP